jgi:hypothetical protein
MLIRIGYLLARYCRENSVEYRDREGGNGAALGLP